MSPVEISVNPRVHVGLISMHENAPRKNGGVGFAVSAPEGHVEIALSDKLTVIDERPIPLGAPEMMSLLEALKFAAQELKFAQPVQVRISGEIVTHVGMGCGTALRLACIEGMARANNVELSKEALLKACGRGGTSGVGVNAYFDGGLIFDMGQPGDGLQSVPSSNGVRPVQALALPPVKMPDWPILLCLPRAISPKSQDQENEFFKRTLPLSEESSFEAAYVANFQIFSSVLEDDYSGFCRGIRAMQGTEWKSAEIAEYGPPLKKLISRLAEEGADCVGMSSLGPMLYCFGDSEILNCIAQKAAELDCKMIFAKTTNTGRILKRGK